MEVNNFYNENIVTKGKITKKMFQNDYRETYKLEVLSIQTEEKIFHFSKNIPSIFVDIPRNLTLNASDIISFRGKITPIYDENTKIEDFEKYSWLHNIYGKTSLYTFQREKTHENNFFTNTRENVKKLIFNGFPIDISALVLGITIGNTDFMTSDIQDEFKNASLTHILVVSGSNITFLILFIGFFLKFFNIKRWVKYSIIFGFILLYAHLVGWEPPVIRATIMGIITYLAISEGWKINSVSLIFLIAVIFSIFSPFALLYDASFGLSFGATLGIITCNDPIQRFLKKFLKFPILATIFSVTLSATI